MSHTVDGVAECVRSLLTSEKGKERIERFNELVARVEKNIPTLSKKIRPSLHRRAGIQFYINASTAQATSRRHGVRMSVRVHGCECGTVSVDLDGVSAFAPSNRRLFDRCGYDKVRGLKWGHPAVARFIKGCVDAVRKGEVNTGRPEASVEAELIARMKSESGGWWRLQQPVCLAGMPLQIPLPITASGPDPTIGDGHIDVLGRRGRGGKGLRIYEVKAPSAPVENALDQAVAYTVALKFLLTQPDIGSRQPWWSLIGFSKRPEHTPRLEAFACVADNCRNRMRVEEACKGLALSNRENIVVDAVFYTHDKSGRLLLAR